MNLLQDAPIRKKITVVMAVTSSLALIVACGTLLFFQSVTLKNDIVRDLDVLTEIVAAQSSAAAAFNDKQAAEEILKSLTVKPQIVSALISTHTGGTLALYGSAGRIKANARDNSVQFRDRYVYLNHTISLDHKPIGTLYLEADFRTTYHELLTFYGMLLGGVTLVTILLIMLLSSVLQRIITRPILQLAATAGSIADQHDYAIRAEKFGNDEIGGLTDAFNFMLTQIQAQDRAIQENRERFEVAVAGSRDGIWDWDLKTNYVYYSPRWTSMLGYAEDEMEPTHDAFVRLLHPEDKDRVVHDLLDYLAGENSTFESIAFRMLKKDGDYCWILSRGAAQRDQNGRPYRMAGSHTDITERKLAEQELESLNKQLVETSRQAGMADVATGVLHNVGNVLNSVNVSASLIADKIRHAKVINFAKAAALLNNHLDNPDDFLKADPKGRELPKYFQNLADHFIAEQEQNLEEISVLTKSVEHIKEIVAMQQSYARVSGATSTFNLVDIVEDAIKINMAGFSRHRVTLVREYEPIGPVHVDRHKALQVLINLFNNAKYAVDSTTIAEKQITAQIKCNDNDAVQVIVRDNGVGITPENLVKVFSFGFTTRKDGHGFGLHSGAIAAKEMGGSLTVQSDGPGKGAAFILELPLIDQETLPRYAANSAA